MFGAAVSNGLRGEYLRSKQLASGVQPGSVAVMRQRFVATSAETSQAGPAPTSSDGQAAAGQEAAPGATIMSGDKEVTIEDFINMTDDEIRAQDIKVVPQIVDVEAIQRENNPFNITRGQVILFTFAAPVLLWLLYEGLKLIGVPEQAAIIGMNVVVVGGGLFLWTGSYVFRVYTKNTTFSKQLRIYEDRVMQKRLEEMTPIDLRDFLKRVYDKQATMSEEEKEAMTKGQPVDATSSILLLVASVLGLVVLLNLEGEADQQRQRLSQQYRNVNQVDRDAAAKALLKAEDLTVQLYAPPTLAELDKLSEE